MSASLNVCCLLVLFTVVCYAADQTRQPGAIGSEVVDAVVNLIRESCLFADDKRFLVRLAYVQSHNGYDAKTFRDGYHGGIWQVDKNMFDETHSNSGRLTAEYNIIRNIFGIDWSRVTWSDLRKPLHSGISAALYTILHGGTEWRIEDQAHFYELHFVNKAGNNFTNEAGILDQGCHGNEKLDLAFIIDRSNSLSTDDFARAKIFVRNVVDSFDISPNKTRVAVVSYASHAKSEFYLNRYTNKVDLKNAISAIPFVGGSTATSEAIDLATTNIFTPSHGSRNNAVKVMVVITDGDANDEIDTGHAADRAHRAGITVFSIGVGSHIQKQTLNTIASNPDCTHVFSVSSYSEIKAIKEEIQKSTCRAPIYIDKTFCCTLGECPTLAYNTKIGGVTLESNVTCGLANIYTAFSNPYPSQSFYEQITTVSSETPGVMFINSSTDHTLYINMVDALKSSGGSGNCEICISPKDGDQRNHNIKCYQNGVEVPCPDNCEEKWNLFPKVCTVENLKNGHTKFEHPFSKLKYLMCDQKQQLYVVHCPQNQSYYQECEQCVGEGSSCPNLTVPLTGLVNPCSLENILKGNFFFKYPTDVTKFIHCDVWGKAWIMSCPRDEEWDQHELTCIVPSSYENPCRNYKVGDPLFYPYPCDSHKYIQCDLWHQSFLMTCQLNFVFSPVVRNCVPRNSYTPPTHDPLMVCPDIHAHPTTQQPIAIIPGNGGATGSTYITYTFCGHCQAMVAPCTSDHLIAGEFLFPVTGNRHQYIQCDLSGHQYLKECPNNSYYFDGATHTCVDGPFQVDNSFGK
ncbi:Collagen alpha-1(XII) chain [Mytilus coruscus]|uniref:Collagen alpha-1(XII) chain n=1 Tax=Mytilus coruscus TaxID=42192 RepID=A0A6J8A6T7_MYTCO|nr:Collagen alpha-1(XII) chain [Mytilus coruscus]